MQSNAAVATAPGDFGENIAFVVQAMSSVCNTGVNESTTDSNGLEKWRSDSSGASNILRVARILCITFALLSLW